MEKKRWTGLGLFLAGIFIFFFNPLGSLTGFTIAENISFSSSWALYFSGLVLILVGSLLMNMILEKGR
jgi:putative Mn2+ efflux pump MntP